MSYVKKVDSVNRYIYLQGSKDVLQIGSVMKKSFMQQFLRRSNVEKCRKM